MYNIIMHSLNSFLSCSIRNLTLASLSHYLQEKFMFFSFLQVLIPPVVFCHESNKLKINCITFLQGILFTQFHIMMNYNHRTSWDKIWAREWRIFLEKVVIFPSFSLVIMNIFLTNQTNFLY